MNFDEQNGTHRMDLLRQSLPPFVQCGQWVPPWWAAFQCLREFNPRLHHHSLIHSTAKGYLGSFGLGLFGHAEHSCLCLLGICVSYSMVNLEHWHGQAIPTFQRQPTHLPSHQQWQTVLGAYAQCLRWSSHFYCIQLSLLHPGVTPPHPFRGPQVSAMFGRNRRNEFLRNQGTHRTVKAVEGRVEIRPCPKPVHFYKHFGHKES